VAAALVWLGPIALALVAAVATYGNVTAQEANLGRRDQPVVAQQQPTVSRCPLTLPDQVGVTLIVTKLSVTDRSIDVVPLIDIPSDISGRIVRRSDRQPVVSAQNAVVPADGQDQINVEILELITGAIQSEAFPISALASPSSGTLSLNRLTLPMVGEPRNYPNDDYVGLYAVRLSLPSSLAFIPRIEGDIASVSQIFVDSEPSQIPIESTVTCIRAVQTTSDFIVQWANLQSDYPPHDTQTNSVLVRLFRDDTTLLYVYGMIASLPIAGIIIGALLGGINSLRTAHGFEVGLAVLAALLAVLPLRTVLVPTDVVGISRVDLLLGDVIIIFISFLAFAFTIKTWPR
jgi:hypothetical protein